MAECQHDLQVALGVVSAWGHQWRFSFGIGPKCAPVIVMNSSWPPPCLPWQPLFAQCVAWCKSKRLPLRFASTLFMSCVLPDMSWGVEFLISSPPGVQVIDTALRVDSGVLDVPCIWIPSHPLLSSTPFALSSPMSPTLGKSVLFLTELQSSSFQLSPHKGLRSNCCWFCVNIPEFRKLRRGLRNHLLSFPWCSCELRPEGGSRKRSSVQDDRVQPVSSRCVSPPTETFKQMKTQTGALRSA